MYEFSNLEGAFNFLDKRCTASRRLWTILACPSGKHYVYFSDSNLGQQLNGIWKGVFNRPIEPEKPIQPEKPIEPKKPATFAEALPYTEEGQRRFMQQLANGMKQNLLEKDPTLFVGGHAEEAMIKDFSRVLQKEKKNADLNEKQPAVKMTIYNSDSPCTTQDGSTSSNLPDWPVTCLKKLIKLADTYPDIDFTVYYKKPFKTLENQLAAHKKPKEKELQIAAKAKAKTERRAVSDEDA